MFGKIDFIKLCLLVGLISISCTKLNQENTFTERANKTTENTGSSKLVVELPVKIDSSRFIVFPIKDLLDSNKQRGSYKISKGYHNAYKNLIFQNIENKKKHFLSSKEIKVLNFNQLLNYKNKPEKVIFYRIIDKINKDNQLEKISLYLSDERGKNFTKISPENHHLKDWKYLPSQRKIYFNTIVDINNDEVLDEEDDYFSFSVSIDNFKVNQLLKEELKLINNKLQTN